MAWQSHSEASPGECAAPSTRRWHRSLALEGLEPSDAATGVPAPPASATRGGAGRTRQSGRLSRRAPDPLASAAGALPPLVDRAADSQCPCSNRWSGHDPAVRSSRSLRCRPWPLNGLAPLRLTWASPLLGKTRLASPRGASCLLFLTFPLLPSPAARFAPQTSVFDSSYERGV